MPREKDAKSSGEKLQIAILTLGMTAGGFALLTAILVLHMNPSAAERVENLGKTRASLLKELNDPELRELRAQAKLNEGQANNNRSLRDIIFEKKDLRALDLGTLPAAKITEEGQIQKIEQTVNLKPARLVQILQFLGDLKDAKKTIQIESVTIARDRRSQGDEDAWTCTLRVVDYVQTAA